MKINNFRGDLTDNSAKKEALMATLHGSDYLDVLECSEVTSSASVFKIKLNICLDTLIENILFRK